MVRQVHERYALLFVLGLMILCLWMPFSSTSSPIAYEQLQSRAEQVVQEKGLEKKEVTLIRRAYHLTMEQYSKGEVYGYEGAMNVEEIAIFEAVGEEQATSIKAACEQRIQEQIKSFEGYGETQAAILKKAVVKQYGNVILCVILDDVQTILPHMEKGEGI